MASYEKRGTSVRAIVRLPGGGKKSATFDTLVEAEAWAESVEKKKAEGVNVAHLGNTNADLFGVFLDAVASKTDSQVPNAARIGKWLKDPLAQLRVAATTTHDINQWITRTLETPSPRTGKLVKPSTVNRDLNLMSSAFTYAVESLKWIKSNPCIGAMRPEKGTSRSRELLRPDEIQALLDALGYGSDPELETVPARTAAAFLLALETGMRSGEILRLRPTDYRRELRYIHVGARERGGRKSAMSGRTNINPSRNVPLTERAIELLDKLLATMPKGQKSVPGKGFENPPYILGITDTQRTNTWHKAKQLAGVRDLHFHDTKHEAATRLSKFIDPFALSHAIGTKDIRLLRDTYYVDDASRIAETLPKKLAAHA